MNGVKRWEISSLSREDRDYPTYYSPNREMVEDANGDYILYSDHVATLQEKDRRVVGVLDRLIPWAVRGAAEHPYNSGVGLRIINRAVDLKRDLTGEQCDIPPAAELETTELDLLKQTVEEQAERLEWARGIIVIARDMLACRSAGDDNDAHLYRQMEDLLNKRPKI